MASLGAGILFLVFISNVIVGATSGSPFLNDISEAILLFAASVCFVAVILRSEARSGQSSKK